MRLSDFVNHSYDYRLNWTPLRSITIIFIYLPTELMIALLFWSCRNKTLSNDTFLKCFLVLCWKNFYIIIIIIIIDIIQSGLSLQHKMLL